MLMDGIYIFTVLETKLDDSFPVSQFDVKGFTTPFRSDQNKNDGGIIDRTTIENFNFSFLVIFDGYCQKFFSERKMKGLSCTVSKFRYILIF